MSTGSQAVPQAAPTTAIPQTPGAPPQVMIPGSGVVVPTGSGVERTMTVPAPFRMNAPPWYTPVGQAGPTVWSELGCAVPQPGPQIVTNNRVIWDFNNHCGNALFDVMYKWSADRLMTKWPPRDCLWEMHQLLVLGRNRLLAKIVPDNKSPLVPTKAVPAPMMFLAFPVPLYGNLGCVNQYMGEFAQMVMLMQTEAMMHSDNARSFYITQSFGDVVYPYIKYLLVDMATKFFGEDPTLAADDKYVIPNDKWTAYNQAAGSVSFETTSPTPPLPYVNPTAQDLQQIKGLPYEYVIPFLQPWPDAAYKMATGGIWGSASSPASDSANNAGANASATTDTSVLSHAGGPPQGV